MNERIKELAEQSGIGYLSSVHPSILEKFAKLIVRECARCVTQPTIQAAGQTDIAIQALQDVLANDMKAYFGVEE
jgi:hypothetical protein